MKSWEKIFQAHGNQKIAEVTILMPDKIDFKFKMVKKPKKVSI